MKNRCLMLPACILVSWTAGCKESPPGTPRPPSTEPAGASRTASSPHGQMSGHGTTNRQAQATAAPKGAAPKAMPPVDTSGVTFSDETLRLTGVVTRVPDGWIKEQPTTSMRKAQFRLPKAGNEVEDAEVRITHFPGMKGPAMDERNLQRWYGQFKQPDGSPTAGASTTTRYELGDVVITLVDIPGIQLGGGGPMMGGGAEKPNFRMLAAIVDHPKGPHFFNLIGPSDGVERWKASAVAFLKNFKVAD